MKEGGSGGRPVKGTYEATTPSKRGKGTAFSETRKKKPPSFSGTEVSKKMGVLELDAYEASGGRLPLVGAACRESDVDFPEAVDVEQARVLGSCLEAYDVAG